MTDNPSTVDRPELLSPGAILRQARERAQLSEQQVAQALHMTVGKVRAMESDDYGKLNTDTFIRGYLRSYASYLKLDSASLISAYEQQAITQGLLPSAADTLIRDVGQGRSWSFMLWLSGLLLVLLLISVWFWGNSINQSPMPVVTVPADSALVMPASINGSDDDNDELVNTRDEASVENAEVDADKSVVMVDEESAPQVQVSSSPSLDKLSLQFTEECWVEVSDAQGDVLATDLQRPGSELVLEGRAPFNVKLGNAPAVSLRLNDQPLILDIPVDTRVMIVTLGEPIE